MGNFITSHDLITATLSASTEHASFPAWRAGVIRKPYLKWASTEGMNRGASANWLGLDLGSAIALTNAALVIDNINAATIRVESSTAADYSANLQNIQHTITRDVFDGRYKAFIPLTAHTTGGNKRYVRVRNDATADVLGGAGPFSIGSLLVCRTYQEHGVSGGVPYEVERIDPEEANASAIGGGVDPVATGNPYLRISFPVEHDEGGDTYAIFQNLIGSAPGQNPFVFFRNYGAAHEVAIVRWRSIRSMAKLGPNAFRVSRSVELHEVV